MWVPAATHCTDQDKSRCPGVSLREAKLKAAAFGRGCLWGGGPRSMGVCFVPPLRERGEQARCEGKGREEEEMKTN